MLLLLGVNRDDFAENWSGCRDLGTSSRADHCVGCLESGHVGHKKDIHQQKLLMPLRAEHQHDNARELYDLAADPFEQDSLIGKARERAAVLDQRLSDYFGWFDAQDYLPPQLSDEAVEALKGVGYLQGVDTAPRTGKPDNDQESDDHAP